MNSTFAYLDNAATTLVCRAAADKAAFIMTACYGNPSSLHSLGVAAEKELAAARKSVADLLGAPPETVVFTSGGTEANNLAILGGAAAKKRRGHHLITTAVEHPSVMEPFRKLEAEGFEVTRLVPRNGIITPEQLADACRPDTILVSIMAVNNETGAYMPPEEFVPAVRERAPEALFHTDAVQAAGKLPLRAAKWGVDLLTVSGHKLHAPKGVGALYIRKGVRPVPQLLGGGQEKGLRSGTEALPAAAGFGAAADEASPGAQLPLYEALQQRLLGELPDGTVPHLPGRRVPYITNFSVPGYRSETLLHFLAGRGVYVSSGSACSGSKRSPVLTAMGLPAAEIDSALRVSFCPETTEADIDRFLEALTEAMRSIRKK